jgi:hypothetical protein
MRGGEMLHGSVARAVVHHDHLMWSQASSIQRRDSVEQLFAAISIHDNRCDPAGRPEAIARVNDCWRRRFRISF